MAVLLAEDRNERLSDENVCHMLILGCSMFCHVVVDITSFLHVLFPPWPTGICLTLPMLSLYLCLDFPPGFAMLSHWLKQLIY